MARILVVHCSGTGNTKKMAELVAEGARGVPGTDVELADPMEVKMDDVVGADGFALGAPDYYSYMAGELKVFFDRVHSVRDKLKGRPCVCFVSHGGGGKAIESVEKLAKAIYLDKAADSVLSKGAPEGETADACRALGKALAEALKK